MQETRIPRQDGLRQTTKALPAGQARSPPPRPVYHSSGWLLILLTIPATLLLTALLIMLLSCSLIAQLAFTTGRSSAHDYRDFGEKKASSNLGSTGMAAASQGDSETVKTSGCDGMSSRHPVSFLLRLTFFCSYALKPWFQLPKRHLPCRDCRQQPKVEFLTSRDINQGLHARKIRELPPLTR